MLGLWPMEGTSVLEWLWVLGQPAVERSQRVAGERIVEVAAHTWAASMKTTKQVCSSS